MALCPVLICLVSSVFWGCFSIVKQDRTLLMYPNLGTIFILLFLFHPVTSRSCLVMLGCLEMEEGSKWLMSDYSVECWTTEHKFYAYHFALPSVLIWGLGIPVTAMILLRQKRYKLNQTNTKLMFCYFFNGYKPEFYLWEFAILWRKISIISLTILLNNNSFHFQILSSIAVMLFFCLLQVRFQPYSASDLNNLELVSIGATLVTLNTAIFYNTEAVSSDTVLVVLLAVLFTANLIFLGFWLIKFADLFAARIAKQFSCLNRIYLRYIHRKIELTKNHSIKNRKSSDITNLELPE